MRVSSCSMTLLSGISRTNGLVRSRTLARSTLIGSSNIRARSSSFSHLKKSFLSTAPTPPPSTSEKEKPAAPAPPSWIQENAPGLAASFGLSLVGFGIAHELGMALLEYQGVASLKGASSPISGIPVCILLGLATNTALNKLSTPSVKSFMKSIKPGVTLATKPILQLGIVCVGFKLSALDLLTTGLIGIPAVLTSAAVGLTFIPWMSRQAGLSPKMGSLIAAGTTICGVTAITAVAPAIKAEPQDAGVAIANVVAFGTLGMLAYPYLAHALLPTSQQVGVFLGLAVHDTSQVIGSALTYQNVYGDQAVVQAAAVTKLTRNLLLAGVVPYLAMKHADEDAALSSKKQLNLVASLKKYTPLFVAGFIGASLVRTGGDLMFADAAQWKDLHQFLGNDLGSKYLLGTAMAGVGLSTNLASLKGVGAKPFLVGLSGALAVGGTGLGAATVMGAFI